MSDRIEVQCPFCGRRGHLPSGVAIPPPKVRCPGCGNTIAPQPIAFNSSPAVASEPTDEPSGRSPAFSSRHWYSDPILQFSIGFPLVVLVALAFYLHREHAAKEFRSSTLALKVQADGWEKSAPRQALDQYNAFLQKAEPIGIRDQEVLTAVAEARQKRLALEHLLREQLA